MSNQKGLNQTIIISIQMIIIGMILTIFALVVILFSPFKTMDPFIKMCALFSDFSILGVGLIFLIAGWFRKKKAKNELLKISEYRK